MAQILYLIFIEVISALQCFYEQQNSKNSTAKKNSSQYKKQTKGSIK
jgi:hypothetical protein